MAILSLIITHHDEPMELGRNLFDSIEIQQGINWNDIEIIVCDNTGKNFDYNLLLQNCPYIKDKIIYLNNPFCEGPGLNKQQGIDYCQTEWLTFLEFDDMLYSSVTLYDILSCINNHSDFDVLQFEHIRSTDLKYDAFVVQNSYGGAWGTVQKKSFFVNNNIRNKNLKMDNDIYINKLGRCVKNKKVEFIHIPIYVWCIRENSTSTIKLSKDSNFEENYKNQMEAAINVLSLVYNYCLQNPEIAEFNYDLELWEELPYFYWKTQMYRESFPNTYNKILLEEKTKKIISLYLSIIDKQWLKNHLNRTNEFSSLYDETFEEWLIRVFNL